MTLSRYNIPRAVNFQLGLLAEEAACISGSARWTIKCGKWKCFFLTFTYPTWILMINLPKISLQIVLDQIALYLVSDCSSRYLNGVHKLFLLTN